MYHETSEPSKSTRHLTILATQKYEPWLKLNWIHRVHCTIRSSNTDQTGYDKNRHEGKSSSVPRVFRSYFENGALLVSAVILCHIWRGCFGVVWTQKTCQLSGLRFQMYELLSSILPFSGSSASWKICGISTGRSWRCIRKKRGRKNIIKNIHCCNNFWT